MLAVLQPPCISCGEGVPQTPSLPETGFAQRCCCRSHDSERETVSVSPQPRRAAQAQGRSSLGLLRQACGQTECGGSPKGALSSVPPAPSPAGKLRHGARLAPVLGEVVGLPEQGPPAFSWSLIPASSPPRRACRGRGWRRSGPRGSARLRPRPSPLLPQFPPRCRDGAASPGLCPGPHPRCRPPAPPLRCARGCRAMELIELRELQPEPRPSRGRLERTNALRISPARRPGPGPGSGAHPDPRLTAAPGAGHRFEPRRRGLHTWCDLCGDFVWGGGRKSLQCRREYRAAPRAARHPAPAPRTGHPATGHPTGHRASRHWAPHRGTGHPATGHPATGHPTGHRASRHRASQCCTPLPLGPHGAPGMLEVRIPTEHPVCHHGARVSRQQTLTPGVSIPVLEQTLGSRCPGTGHLPRHYPSQYRAPQHCAPAPGAQLSPLGTRHPGTGHPY